MATMSFNKVFLAGRLTKEPDSKEVITKNGPTTITEYTLAVDKGFGSNGGADFIPCMCWSQTAEFAKRNLHKGSNIFVIGKWQVSSYTNKDGKRVTVSKCNVTEHHFTGAMLKQEQGDQVRDDNYFVKMAAEQNGETPPPAPDDMFIYVPDDAGDEGLPFN